MHVDQVWKNAQLATLSPVLSPVLPPAFSRAFSRAADGIGRIERGCIAARDGVIVWVGRAEDAPDFDADAVTDCEGRWITPGLIDCHTHLVYAGNRVKEHEARLEGATYADVAAAGGGIVSTVKAVRGATEKDLTAQSIPRLTALMNEGVTTVEIKSGYGLNTVDETKMLRVARQLGEQNPIRVRTTFLGAHALPPEANDDADGYINDVCHHQLPNVHAAGLADAVDAFCETIAFTPEQTQRVFDAAKVLGLPVKLHAEQLSDQKGAVLAAQYKALSADHLEYIRQDGVAAMADSGVVAVMVPGAFYFLRETQVPPIEQFRAAGVDMAVATDCNPGSSPVSSILLAMNMASTLFRMTPTEVLRGVTCNAAKALGVADTVGSLEIGKACDLAIWSVDDPAELVFSLGVNPLYRRVYGGKS